MKHKADELKNFYQSNRYQGQGIAFFTIIHREVRRFLRIWIQTIIPPIITVSLYFIIFGTLIGSQIGHVKGITYVQYITPGLIMMAVINNAYSNVVSSFFGAKFGRYIEEILVAPMHPEVILMGYVTAGVSRGLLVGLGVTIISLFFSHLYAAHIFLMLLVVLLASLLFALAGFCNAIFAKKFDDVVIVPTFIVTPLIYLGGVFYSIEMLPSFWQKVSLFNPIFYIVDAFRYSILGISDVHIFISLFMMCVFVVLLFFYALYLLRRGVGLKV